MVVCYSWSQNGIYNGRNRINKCGGAKSTQLQALRTLGPKINSKL